MYFAAFNFAAGNFSSGKFCRMAFSTHQIWPCKIFVVLNFATGNLAVGNFVTGNLVKFRRIICSLNFTAENLTFWNFLSLNFAKGNLAVGSFLKLNFGAWYFRRVQFHPLKFHRRNFRRIFFCRVKFGCGKFLSIWNTFHAFLSYQALIVLRPSNQKYESKTLNVFDYLGEELSERNRTKLHEKVFSEVEKFPAVKFNGTKKIAAKISCGENSGDEISRSEIGCGENIMRQIQCG